MGVSPPEQGTAVQEKVVLCCLPCFEEQTPEWAVGVKLNATGIIN